MITGSMKRRPQTVTMVLKLFHSSSQRQEVITPVQTRVHKPIHWSAQLPSRGLTVRIV
ncbi:unnamed protein product [Ectocarpus sp. CCAP 1310/34]|nr:unnamed protein product [Ectocarpus sp. CCAP 1310/34]